MAKYGRLANGEGTISKLSGSRRKPFMIQTKMIVSNGSYKREIIGYARTYSEATKLLYDFNSKRIDITKANMTLNDFLIKFLENKKKNVSTNVFKNYQNVINEYLNDIKDTAIINIKYDMLQDILNMASSKGTANTIKMVLSWCFDEAIKREIVQSNIASKLENNIEAVKQKTKTVFTQKEIDLLWKFYNETNKISPIVYLLMLYSGCRVNEILKLTKDMIFINEDYFVTGSKTEAGKDRKIPIHSKIKPIFEKLMRNESILLFTTQKNKKYTTVNFSIKSSSELSKININKTSHECRHTFISELQKLGVQLSKIKTIVGHSQSDITDGVYTHYDIATLKQVVNEIKY